MRKYPEFEQLIRKMGRVWVRNWLFGQAAYYAKRGKECPAWLRTYFGYLIRYDVEEPFETPAIRAVLDAIDEEYYFHQARAEWAWIKESLGGRNL